MGSLFVMGGRSLVSKSLFIIFSTEDALTSPCEFTNILSIYSSCNNYTILHTLKIFRWRVYGKCVLDYKMFVNIITAVAPGVGALPGPRKEYFPP